MATSPPADGAESSGNQRSKSDTLTRDGGGFAHQRGASVDNPSYSGVISHGTVRRKMSESAVLALIKEQSTSRDDSEHSSSQRGATGHSK
jgi:hypothetical protein